MKLNHDCVRDLLLSVEESAHSYSRIDASLFKSFERMLDYPLEDIRYTIEKLNEAGFINTVNISTLGTGRNYLVTSLTWSGHEFLDNVRDDGIWKDTKKTVSKLSSASLGILSEVATGIIKSTLGLS